MAFVNNQYYFFFFQAEDGIRDLIVTGVQTCALPISRAGAARAVHEHRRPGAPGAAPAQAHRDRASRVGGRVRRLRAHPARSEERRVGKSVDLGGRRIIKKKKSWKR